VAGGTSVERVEQEPPGIRKIDDDLIRDVAPYAVAVVAAEMFNRNLVHRQFERIYSKIVQFITGRVPDLSYGTAQIRPSRVRRLLQERPEETRAVLGNENPSDREIVERLWDECASLSLAALILNSEVRRAPAVQCDGETGEDPFSRRCPDRFVAAVRAYHGDARAEFALLSYTAIVVITAQNTNLPGGE